MRACILFVFVSLVPGASSGKWGGYVIGIGCIYSSALGLLLTMFPSPAPVYLDRVLTELVSKMKDMQMDKSELGCLRAIVLFNPGDRTVRLPPWWPPGCQGSQVLSPAEAEEMGGGVSPQPLLLGPS